jgi:hypothetical protein
MPPRDSCGQCVASHASRDMAMSSLATKPGSGPTHPLWTRSLTISIVSSLTHRLLSLPGTSGVDGPNLDCLTDWTSIAHYSPRCMHRYRHLCRASAFQSQCADHVKAGILCHRIASVRQSQDSVRFRRESSFCAGTFTIAIAGPIIISSSISDHPPPDRPRSKCDQAHPHLAIPLRTE